MKGYRFYKEYDSPQDKCKDKPNGNVFAAIYDGEARAKGFISHISHGNIMLEGIGSVYEDANSPVCFTSCSWEWLRQNCKHISETEARQIHPNLFRRIEE